MRLSSAIREASLDLSTGAARTLFTWCVFVLLLGLLVLHELLTVTALIDRAQAYQLSGANTRIVSAAGRIDGHACDALAWQYGVQSAAMQTLPDQLRADVMSSVPLKHVAATPGVVGVLGARGADGHPLSTAGAIVSDAVTELLGRHVTELATDVGEIVLAGVFRYPDDGRRAGLGFTAVFPEPLAAHPYDECWVRSWPEHPDTLAMLNSVVLPADTVETAAPELTQLNTTLGISFEGERLFTDRLSRFNPLLALLGSGILAFFAVWARRLEIAAARHAGVTLADVLVVQLLQHGVWIVLGAAFVVCLGGAIGLGYPDAWSTLTELSLRSIGLATVGALLGVCSASASIRERALFRYFQHRS